MCGRYTLRTPTKDIVEAFGLANSLDLTARYNIAPTQQVPAVWLDLESGTRQLSMFRWGLIPFWAKDTAIGNRMINARAESITSKPAFRDSFQKRRCLVVADGFYEWKAVEGSKVKQPYFVRLKDDQPFAFAGLYDRRKGKERTIESCTIITTEPNELMEPLHDRMPAILAPEHYDLWLDPEYHGQGKLLSMLKPYDAHEMEAFPVSTEVNSPRNESPKCVEAMRQKTPGYDMVVAPGAPFPRVFRPAPSAPD